MNLRAIKADAAYVLRAWLRGRSGVVVSLAMPLILLVGLGLIVGPGAVEPPLVHVADLAGSPESQEVVAAIEASAAVRIERLATPPSDVAEWMSREGARGYVEIPPGLDPPRVVVDASRPAEAAAIRDAVDAALARVRTEGAASVEEVHLPPEDAYSEFLLPGVVGLTVLAVGLPLGFASVAELRHHGLLERLAVSPMTRREWLLGRMLGASIVAVTSAALLVAVAWGMLGVRPSMGPWSLVLILAGTLVFSGLGALLGGIVRRPENGSALLNLLLLPIVLLSGSFFDVDILPTPLGWLSLASPLTHLNAGLRLDMLEADAGGAALHAAALAIAAFLLLAAGGPLVRWTAHE